MRESVVFVEPVMPYIHMCPSLVYKDEAEVLLLYIKHTLLLHLCML